MYFIKKNKIKNKKKQSTPSKQVYWFSQLSNYNRHDITEILLKVALNTINQTFPIINDFMFVYLQELCIYLNQEQKF